MFPVIVHPVFVNAVVLATPTSPAVVDLVQVTAGPPRIAKLNTEPPDCAAALRAVTSSTPNNATTANRPVSRGRVNMGFSLAVVSIRGGARDPFWNGTSLASPGNLPQRATGGYRSAG